MFGDETFRDRVELKPEDFYRKMRVSKAHPTTSQPTPGEFVRVLRDARAEADRGRRRCCSRPGSRGPISPAVAGGRGGRTSKDVYFVDSASASLGLGLLALRAAELAEAGWAGPGDRGGAAAAPAPVRVLRDRGSVRQPASVRSGDPRQGVDRRDAGREADPLARRRGCHRPGGPGPGPGEPGSAGAEPAGAAAVAQARLRFVSGSFTPKRRRLAERVRAALVAAYQPRDCFVTLATGVLGRPRRVRGVGGLLAGRRRRAAPGASAA